MHRSKQPFHWVKIFHTITWRMITDLQIVHVLCILFYLFLNVLRYSLLFSIMRYRNFYSCILSRYNYWIENAWWFPIQYCIPALLWDSCHDVLVFSCMVLFICTKESKWSECKEMHSLRSKLCSVLVLSTGSMTSWCDGPLEI